MPELDPEKYYDDLGEDEFDRHEKRLSFRLEFKNTLNYLREYLPEEGKVLDAGGASGRYAIWMAKRGLDVTLVDISKGQIKIAENKIKEAGVEDKVETRVRDIRSLDVEKNSFDATVCLGGPLSHILSFKEREKALEKLKRATKPKSPFLASFISLYGAAQLILLKKAGIPIIALEDLLENRKLTEELSEKYDFEPNFTSTRYFTSDEIEEMVERNGLRLEEVIGLQNIAGCISDEKEYGDREEEVVNRVVRRFLNDERFKDLSQHLLAITYVKE